MSKLENALMMQIKAQNLPIPETEYRFAAEYVGTGKGLRQRLQQHDLRDWRFDFAWPGYKIAVEVEGGLFINGRHNTGKGYEMDLLKYSKAMRLGWTVYRCGKALIQSGEAIGTIMIIMECKQKIPKWLINT